MRRDAFSFIMARHSRRGGVLGRVACLALLLCGLFRPAAAAVAPAEPVPVSMKAGFMASAFLQSNRNDVEAALKALAESIGRERGFQVTVQSRSFHNAATFHEAIKAGEINVAVYDSLTFVAEPHPGDLTPVFIPVPKSALGRRYQVLVRRDSGLRTLDDLRAKSIVELQAPDLSVGHTWLLSLLLAKGVRAHEEFFGSVEYVDRPTAAVLPVFFGRKDACLVDDLAFNLMVELNPQVGARLQSLEISAPLVGAVVCVSESSWASREFRPAFLKALGELHLMPAGRQMLNLFKMDHLVPFREADLDTARELWASYSGRLKEARP
jgi:ABC-type phosphate/phosphonate transport system substrate-binding protein